MHTLRLLLAAALLSWGAVCACASPFGSEWYEQTDSTASDIKDSRLVEHLLGPEALGRAWAAYFLSLRWSGSQYVTLLKEDWKAGIEAVAGGWPHKDEKPLVDYLLGLQRTPSRSESDILVLSDCLAAHTDGDTLVTWSKGQPPTSVAALALQAWKDAWVARTPLAVLLPDSLWYASTKSRRWLRDAVYERYPAKFDKPDDELFLPWQKVEYSRVLALWAGDTDIYNKEDAAASNREFLMAVAEALSTGKNPCDHDLSLPEDSKLKDTLQDWNWIYYKVVDCQVAYAEIVALVMDRPDWIPAIRKRLAAITVSRKRMVLEDATKGKWREEHYQAVEDRRSPLVQLLACVSTGDYATALQLYEGYLRNDFEKNGMEAGSVPTKFWLSHPWFRKCLEKSEKAREFREAWDAVDRPFEWK